MQIFWMGKQSGGEFFAFYQYLYSLTEVESIKTRVEKQIEFRALLPS